MPSAVIGALRVDLNLGTAGWKKGLAEAQSDAQGAAAKFKAVGGTITAVGAGLTAGITAPLLGIGVAAVKTAANFEAAMIKVKIATQATGDQMKQMNDLALQLGKSTVFSASEAAGAMEELAKNGVSVENILGGAAKAAVDLAAAAGSELGPAAVAVSDAMNQFHLSSKDLPALVNQITGAVNESKLDFNDFQLGMAQAGGVAGAVGVSFEDFNAVLAGTSSMFSSGSDAGTSFKTFLNSLGGSTKQAKAMIEQYGLSFYDAAGKLRPMADIAEQLRVKLGGLSDEAKTNVLKTIFGTDAMRTAVGLMNQGAKGLDDIAARIKKTDAAAQSAERMKGLNAQLEQLGGTLETLAIQIGQTGLLDSVTSVLTFVTDMLDKLTELSPAAAQIAVVGAAIAAAIGPIMLVLGPVISGIGSLITLFGAWSASLGAASAAAGGFLPLLAPFAPIVLGIAAAVAAGYVAWQNWGTIAPILQGLWQTFQSTLGPPLLTILSAMWDSIKMFGSAFATLATGAANALGPAFLGIFKAAADVIGGAMKVIGNLLSAVIDLLQGNFSGAWTHTVAAVKAAASGIGSAVADLVTGVLGSLGRMVSGIWDHLVNQLGGAWDALKKRIADAKNDFFSLYDAVVGHSYIPDMVDGIAQHMARLDGVMTKPVKDATGKAKDAFKQLRDDLAPILNELFPESRQLVDMQNKLSVIGRAEKAGVKNGGLSADQADEARRRVALGPTYDSDRQDALAKQMDDWGQIDIGKVTKEAGDFKSTLPDLSKTAEDTRAKTVEAFAGMARDVLGSLRGMVSAFKGGDILGGISGLFDIISQVSGLIGGNKTARQAVTVTGGGTSYGGGRALGGPVVPGKRYKVGESGKPEWFEPMVPGRVVPESGGAGGGGTNIYFSGVMTSEEFWDKINAGHDNAALRGANGGAQLAMERQTARAQRSLG